MAASPSAAEPIRFTGTGDVRVGPLEDRIGELRALDYRCGGGSCLDDVLTLIHRVSRDTAATGDRAGAAVADLHSLAGWASFDIGLVNRAHVHFAQALVIAGEGRNSCQVADILYRMGQVRLHHGDPAGALEFFQIGQVAAGPECALESSILFMSQAWAHAVMGSELNARAMMDRGAERFAESGTEPPSWAGFFTGNDMLAMVGTVHTELARRVDPRHVRVAIPALTQASDGYGDDMARSRTFSLIMLSMNLLADGDVDHGVAIGMRALAAAETLSSLRVRDRMHPLKADADLHGTHPGARDLAARIAARTS
ncbi:hypothetical protein [Kibdelosporangium phytohabitans]|uniref:Transcriptional regulator n=1 Tax=Kibdelosporangium phytohabitans TaxID=860235 RepID=A0A0N9I9N0_9PSEU|nr:hypothetical protein [Kibdelosporangium phytohabitans]ALG13081.1 hypothetical protein AOZ06_45045 [Kibdelosporangium phytohabitans]MBE1464819.1 hypothetical protein [Kibdelosporangium phytohabitans]